MKFNKSKLTIIAFLLLSVFYSGCKKDNNETPTDPNNTSVFLKFSLAGSAKSFTNTKCDLYYLNHYLESYIGDSDNGIYLINEDYNDITVDSLKALKGKKLPMTGSGVSSSFYGRIMFDDGPDYYDSEDADSNPFPANYFRINNVTLIKTATVGFQTNHFYLVEGDFNCNTSNGIGADKAITNGSFKMVVLIFEL